MVLQKIPIGVFKLIRNYVWGAGGLILNTWFSV